MFKKKHRITPRDLEKLSAYLDGQLSSREIVKLQARLKDDLQMQKALDELRTTRLLLRSLPRLRAPRNFTLKAEMVGLRTAPRRSSYPAFGYASVAATLLLVLVFVADRASFVNTTQITALQSAAQSTQMEEIVETMVVESLSAEGISATDAEVMLEMEAPMMAAEAQDSSLAGESAPVDELEPTSEVYPEPTESSATETEAQTTPPPSMKIVPEASATSSASMQESTGLLPAIPTATPTPTPFMINGTEVIGVGGGLADTPYLTETPTPEYSETPTASPTPSPTCTFTITPSPTELPAPSDTPLPPEPSAPAEMLLKQQVASETPQPPASLAEQMQDERPIQRVEQGQPARSWFLAIEIVLGLLAAGSGLIFLYLYRKSN